LFKKWSWDDGVGETRFTDWAVGQPYDEVGVPGCGVVDVHAKWRVSHCETERRSVCQKADNGLGNTIHRFPIKFYNGYHVKKHENYE